MKKTVTFLEWSPKRNSFTDNPECRVKFSVIDTALIGTPREHESIHTITITISDTLLQSWSIPGGMDFGITDEIIKVTLQSLEDYLLDQLKRAPLPDGELEPITKTTKNSPEDCPYTVANILYPSKTSFTVEIEDQPVQPDTLSIHPNIRILIERMDDALKRDDYPGVLHAGASIFETLAKDVIGIPSIENQTLKSFFDRYRKDSALPDEILNYILASYELRSTTPIAGHGSITTPSISRKEAIALSEMSKASVMIEYKSRQ